jgi:hypothetical protein
MFSSLRTRCTSRVRLIRPRCRPIPDRRFDSIPRSVLNPCWSCATAISCCFPRSPFQFSARTPRISATNLLQGAVVYHGQGRLAVFGEAAMFSAQVVGPDKRPIGMNAPDARDNYRLALNLLHWLSAVQP